MQNSKYPLVQSVAAATLRQVVGLVFERAAVPGITDPAKGISFYFEIDTSGFFRVENTRCLSTLSSKLALLRGFISIGSLFAY